MPPEVFALRQFAVTFPGFRLGPLSFDVATGERVALVGPNGAGKSTTMRALAGCFDDYTGDLEFGGASLRRQLPQARARIGVLSEDVAAYPWMRVREHLALLAAFYPSWDAGYAASLLGRLGVDPQARMGTLSKGTRVKVGFVAAESFRPPVILLDEPTSGLDPVVRRELLAAVQEAMGAGPARSLIFSTHILEDVDLIAERVLVLRAGTLAADLSVEALRAQGGQLGLGAQLYEVLSHA